MAIGRRRDRSSRETIGTDARDLLLAVADGLGIALAPPSTLRAIGDAGRLVTARTLDPAVHMPDTLVARCTDPQARPPDGVIEVAREAARPIRAS